MQVSSALKKKEKKLDTTLFATWIDRLWKLKLEKYVKGIEKV